MARYLLAPTSTTATTSSAALLPKDAAKNSPLSRTLRLRALGSRSDKARPIMAVASEQAAPAAGYPKVAAPTTGPIPAAELLGVIEAAAKAGADVIMEAVNKPRNIHYKGVADLVTDTDKLSESVILEVVTKNFKDHLILGEEGGLIGDSFSEYLWCIDPLGLGPHLVPILMEQQTLHMVIPALLCPLGFSSVESLLLPLWWNFVVGLSAGVPVQFLHLLVVELIVMGKRFMSVRQTRWSNRFSSQGLDMNMMMHGQPTLLCLKNLLTLAGEYEG